MPLTINVSGPASDADAVGAALSTRSAFLQHPFFLEPGCRGYFNPQLFRFGNEMQDLTHLVGLNEKDLRAKAISDEVENVLASLEVTASVEDPTLRVGNGLVALHTSLTEYANQVPDLQELLA